MPHDPVCAWPIDRISAPPSLPDGGSATTPKGAVADVPELLDQIARHCSINFTARPGILQQHSIETVQHNE
jgi:hypothetical protein